MSNGFGFGIKNTEGASFKIGIVYYIKIKVDKSTHAMYSKILFNKNNFLTFSVLG